MNRADSREANRVLEKNRARDAELRDRYRPELPFTKYLRRSQEAALHGGLDRHRRLPLGQQTLLEVGCGKGNWLQIWQRLGGSEGRVSGIDIDAHRIEVARARFAAADLRVADATDLPWPERSFDIVFQSTVFTSILDPSVRQQVAREMRRVVADDGLILWYDFFIDNPQNPAVRGVSNREIGALFPDCRIDRRRVVLAPPLARALAPLGVGLCRFVERFVLLNAFYFAVIQPSPS